MAPRLCSDARVSNRAELNLLRAGSRFNRDCPGRERAGWEGRTCDPGPHRTERRASEDPHLGAGCDLRFLSGCLFRVEPRVIRVTETTESTDPWRVRRST